MCQKLFCLSLFVVCTDVSLCDAEVYPASFQQAVKSGRVSVKMRRVTGKECVVAVHFQGRYVTSAVLDHLPNLLHLEEVSLEFCYDADAAMPTLSRCSNLRRLHLSYSTVTDKGVAKLVNLSKLDELYLSGT